MNETGRTIFIKDKTIKQKHTLKNIILMIFLILFLSSVSFSIKATPDGYCPETISDFHTATWVTNVDYELLPNVENPESIKITVDIFFTTEGVCVLGYSCQPDPECDEDFRYVNAWIDWDGDYNFSSSEQVLDEELFWYDENYQDWLITNYEGDPLDMLDIILLPRENFTGKSIRWFTFDSFAGGMGIMTVTKIIPMPDSYGNDTWMRVNYGWLYNPQTPCELFEPTGADPYTYWEYGDATYKQISTTPDLSINASDIIIKPKSSTAATNYDLKNAVLTVTVHNKGKTTVKNVDVLMNKQDGSSNIATEIKTITSIPPEDYVNISFEGNFDPYRFETISIELDPENTIWETSEKNNKATTNNIEGLIVQYNETFSVLPKTRVNIEQKSGTDFKNTLTTYTDEEGFYKVWTNTQALKEGLPTRVNAKLEYSPTRNYSDTIICVINESDFGDNAYPNDYIGNNKSSTTWTLQHDQDYTYDICYSGIEGGLAYQTLITAYTYHEKLKTAPARITTANINDDDYSYMSKAGPYVQGFSIHLPPGKAGTTRPSAIGHEFTHIVEYGWLPTHYGHHPLVPVEEGSCHWGSCISRNNSLYEFPSRATGGYVIIDVSKDKDTCNSTPAPATSTGCREEFQIAGTMWDLNATLVWNVLRYGYGLCNPLWPSTPVLFYNAYKEIDARSSPTIKGIFQSHAYNTSLWPGKDGQDPDYFTDIFSDQRVDSDSDGKYETLQVTVELNMSVPGNYILTGVLGGTDVGGSNTTSLEYGVQLVNLSFFGENIYESQQDGPYNLSFYLYDEDYTFLDIRTAIYDTQYYSYTEFERPTLLFTGNQTAYGTDSDGDGIFDQLIVDLELNLTESSYVKMYANLYSNDTFIDNCWGPSMYDDAVYEYLESGVQHLLLYFNGESIYASGLNGSYELRTYLSNARTLQLGFFNYTDFAQPPAFIGDLIEESGIDETGDGFYDALNVNISVNGLGTYSLSGYLYNETGAHIITTHQTDDINLTQSILLSFDGKTIRDQQRSGVYILSVELYDMNGFFLGWKNYTLSMYDHTDFEPSSDDIFEITCNDYGIDSNGHSGYEELRIDLDITSLLPGMYDVEGYLCTANGEIVCFDETTSYLDETVESLSLLFDGQRLGSSFYNGSYTLDLIFKNSSGIVELEQVYSTSYYSFDSFESSYVLNTTDKLYSYGGSETVANRLGVTAEIYSTIPRYVTFKARLLDSTGELIAESKTGDIWAYENDTALILFDGGNIYAHGIDGPYTIVLRLYDENGVLLDSFNSITNYYDHSRFLLISLTGTYTDYGIDLNSDTVFDYLVIEADVHVSTDGFCTITGTLEDATGEAITTSENTLWLPEGFQILSLYFNGSEIKNHGVNGPYYLKHVVVSHNADVTITDYMVDAYVTSAYDYNNFTLSASILPNQKPISIAMGPKGGTSGESLLFNGSASYDPEGQLLTYSWEFGDGASSTEQNPTHSYSSEGIYTVSFTVNDSTQDSNPQELIVSIGYPVADAGGPYIVYGIQETIFNGSASFDPEEQLLTYSWNFGDGVTSTQQNPMHNYSAEGVYTLTLIVNDGMYESNMATTTVTVLKSLSLEDESTDEGYDQDNDTFYDYLIVKTGFANYMPQNISYETTLLDSYGTVLSYGQSPGYFLNASSYVLSIYFDGITLFENMVDGPYYVELIIRDEYDIILDSKNYVTSAYEYTDFQYITKIGNISDYGSDIGSNGIYDYLMVDVELITREERDIVLKAELFDGDGTSIATVQNSSVLSIGNTTLQILFEGTTINSHKQNGPYTIIFDLEDAFNVVICKAEHDTFAYSYTDFEERTSQIWTVDDDNLDIPISPADFSTIQEAIDAAANGDEILVYTGTYYERIDLNKSVTLAGIGLPLIDADWGGHGIEVTADGCIIKGFLITNAYMGDPDTYTAGIYVLSGNNTIMNNSFEYNENGISLVQSHDNVVENNTLIVTSYNDEVHNIILIEAKRNTIIENSCIGGGKGITAINSSSNLIYLNTLGNGNYNGYDNSLDNMWNSTEPVEYIYNGSVYSSCVGNYWEGHVSTDNDNDGICDTPYTNIEGSGNAIDYYPMVGNWPPTAEANGNYRADDEENITFNSTGSFDPDGDPLTYFWDFDDGNTSTDANPVYAYNISDGERGKFYADLTVSDGVYTDSDSATVYINYPIAVAGGPYCGVEGESVTLDGSASYDPLGPLYKYYWIPDASGYSPSWSISSKKYVTYNSEGNYTPGLRVWSMATGVSVFSSYDYTVVYVNDTDPIPDFTCIPQNGQTPLTVDFMDISTSYDGITLWEWDFDDDGIIDVSGTDSAAQNPSFTYATAGVYSVNLTVHEADGDIVSMIKPDHIFVNAPRPPITIYVPDDYSTIQDAIDAGTTIDGDIIIVRDGIYRQNIVVNKELIIRSDNGSEYCQLFPEVRSDHMIAIISNNVTIDGFFMNGTRSTFPDKYGSLYVDGVFNVTICNNWINDSSYGIVLENSHNITIINNTIINSDDSGIYGYSDNDFITIIGNNLSNSDNDGLKLYGDYCIICNNTAIGNGYSGIVISGDHNDISGNIMNGNGVVGDSSYEDCGLRVTSGNQNNICNNTMNNNSEYGLFLGGAYNIVHDNIMQENAFYDFFTRARNTAYSNTGSGDRPIIFVNETSVIKDIVVSELILVDADYSLIQNVTVAGSETLRNNGIYARSCDYVEFTNVTSNHNYHGIDMTPTVYSLLVGQEDNIFTDCTFKDNRRDGVRIGGDRNKFENCDISFNNDYGLYFYECSEDSIVVNSTLNNNSGYGIYLRVDYTRFHILNNTINGGSSGIYCGNGDYVGTTPSNVTISHNTISNNTNDAICLNDKNRRHGYLIHDNVLKDNVDCGLFILVQYCNFEVFNNTITGNYEGISCENTYWDEDAHVNITYNTILDNNYGIGINKINDHPNNYLISDNIIEYNAVYGIYISPVSGTLQIVNNSIIGNANGIYCNHGTTTGITTHVTIGHNTISDNDDAINITDKSISHNYLIHNTIIENNAVYGIFIGSVSGTLQIVNNMITENNDGIYCENSICDENAQATITHNIISHNNNNGIRTNDLSIQFLIYDNIIVNNSVHDIAENSWNITKTSGPNIIGGPYIGGNYWSDYAGVDLDVDFLGDTNIPFNASGKITMGGDYHPLVMSQELYLFPIQDQMMYEDTIRSVSVCALGTDTNAIILSADGLPSFGVFSDEGNGIGIIDFMPDSGDKGDYMIIINATDGVNTVTESFNLCVFAMNHLPAASFMFEPETPTTLDTIYFNSTSTDPDGSIVNWTWDMDDGTILYGEQVAHQFATAATYNVCLIVEDNDGFIDTLCKPVIVDVFLGPGNTCDDPIIVEIPADLNYSDLNQTTCGRGNEYEDTSTSYNLGEDIFYRLDVTADITVRIEMAPYDNWTGLFLYDDRPDALSPGDWLAAVTDYNSNPRVIIHNLTAADSPYYIMADSYPDPTCYGFDLIVVSDAAVNQPPVADAGGPYSGLLGEDIQLDGSGSVDLDGTIVSYDWDLDDDGAFDDAAGINPTYTWTVDGTYTISLRVTDSDGATDNDSAIVTTSTPNQSPIADAGGPYSGETGQSILLDGSGSYDLDGTIVSYDWDLDDDGAFDDAAGITPHISWPAAGIYTVSLQVTDDDFASDFNTTTVTIIMPNQPPVAENDSYSLDEDSLLVVSASGVLTNDYDADGDSFTAQLYSPTSHGELLLNTNGSFSYTPDPNYSGYDAFSYTAINGSQESLPAFVNLSIQPINDAPILNGIPDQSMNEGDTLNYDCIGFDVDGDTLTYLPFNLPDFGAFNDDSDGMGHFSFAPDFEDAGVYHITLTISDGTLISNRSFNLTVSNVNRPPNQPSNPTPTDGSTVGTGALCLTWSAEDPDFDELSYDLYFSTDTPPTLRETNLTESSFCGLFVECATTYYWQLRSIDNNGAATFGPIWSFTTSYTAEMDLHKTVSSDGIHWSQNLTVESGEEVFWNISVCNSGQSLLTNVLLLDSNGYCYVPFNLNSDEHRFFTYSSTVFEDLNNTVFASAVDCNGHLLEEESYAYVHVISDDTIDIELCKSATLEYVSSGDFEGLSHGFWKNHESEWVGYSHDDMTGEIFEIPHGLSCCNDSFHNALRFKGGNSVGKAAKLLMIQAVAALLNAAHPDINYPLSESEIITLVNDALATENRKTLLQLKDILDDYNNCCGDKCCGGGGSSEQIARITYTINVKNNGSIKANTIGILDLLPDDLSLISWTASVGVFDVTTGIWSIDSLFAGDFEVLCLTTETSISGLYLNTAELMYVDESDVDSIPGNGVLLEDDMDCVQTAVQLDDAEYIDLELCLLATVEYIEETEFEGLSHGFWKNHEEEWVGYVPSDMTGDIFDIPDELSSVNDTLRNALRFKGGKGVEKAAKLLMVQSVAALLNTAHPVINYPLSESALISSVNDALASFNRQTMLSLKDTLDEYNNLGGDLKDCCKNIVCTITFIITLNNNGSTDATGINVTDILPEDLTYISDETALGSYDVITGIWDVGFLQAYGGAYLEIVVETNISGFYSNTAEVTYANEVDSDSIPNNHDASEDDQDMLIVEVILGDDCD